MSFSASSLTFFLKGLHAFVNLFFVLFWQFVIPNLTMRRKKINKKKNAEQTENNS